MRILQFSFRNQSNIHLGIELEQNGDIIDLVQLPIKDVKHLIEGGEEILEEIRK